MAEHIKAIKSKSDKIKLKKNSFYEWDNEPSY